MRQALAAAFALLLVAPIVGGCAAIEHESSASVDVGDVPDSLIAAVPRVSSVGDATRWQDGLGYGLELSLTTDSPGPFGAAEVDAALQVIWSDLPWEPSAIALFASGPDGDAVDLRAGGADLAPLRARDAGQAGIIVTGMRERYGER